MINLQFLYNKKIVVVSEETQEKLNELFMRFQEHYESPEFRGKIFTVGQFKSWYSSVYGADTYARDWSGFNIPSVILVPFIQGLFDPLTSAETEFLNAFRYRTDKFYIIGAQEGDLSTLKHEIAHGLYYIRDDYRDEADNLVSLIPSKIRLQIKQWLLKKGYTKEVVDDEIQAYIVANRSYIFEVIGQEEIDLNKHPKLKKSLENLIELINEVK